MGNKILKHLLTLIIVLCVGGIGWFGWQILQTQLRDKREQEDINQLYEIMAEVELEVESTSVVSGESEEAEEEAIRVKTPKELTKGSERMLAQYAKLHEKNSDMVGWIYIDNTPVNYPVLHTPGDSEFYLRRNFNKEYAYSGMIYLDGDCIGDGTDRNTLIYGHHMRNGTMFGSLQEYDSKEYRDSHPYIMYNTLNEVAVYEVVAAFKCPAAMVDNNFKTMLFARTDQQFDQLVSFINSRRFYDTGLDLEYTDQLITLATCEYTQGDGRLFVVAKRIGIE